MKEMSDADEYEARSVLINRIVKIVSVVFVLWLVLEVVVDKYLLFKVEEVEEKRITKVKICETGEPADVHQEDDDED